jgi:hypothetical protein
MPRDTSKQQERTKRKHDKVRRFFENLHEKKRLRYDDAIEKAADEYDYSVSTVETIIQNTRQRQLKPA